MAEDGPLLLRGAVQHYAWGGRELIPSLLGVENPAGRPFAELWLGAHPAAPALLETPGGPLPLDRYIAARPAETLGPAAPLFENRLPFLLKVLDARSMLSIQVHPDKRQAEEGFRRENGAGVPPGAPHRNYKDPNHKPEVHVALSEFWMLHGFRPLDEILRLAGRYPELSPLMSERAAGLREIYTRAMSLPQASVDALLNPLIARLEQGPPPAKHSPDYWALRAAREFPLPGGGRDRGLFSIYLLNLLRLEPGEGTYQPAGVPHAYLEGATVELMANSDNVLRAGLTPKHVDVDELLRAVSFECGAPEILRGVPVSAAETAYRTAAEEFELSRLALAPGASCAGVSARGPEILLAIEGQALLRAGNRTLDLPRGKAAFVPYGCRYVLEGSPAGALLFKAALPASSARPQ